VDLYRDNSVEHLTFGYGAHQCMGKNIGRMEMRVFLEEFVRRLPHIRLVEGQSFDLPAEHLVSRPGRAVGGVGPARNPERANPRHPGQAAAVQDRRAGQGRHHPRRGGARAP
jgi:hypothetical protein